MSNLPFTPPTEHPRWCDLKTCERLHAHWSTVRHVDTGREEETVLDAALVQPWHPTAVPQISLTVIDGISVDQLLLSLRQAAALSYRLRQLLDAAKRGQR